MAKTKARISYAVTAQLICVFVFAYVDRLNTYKSQTVLLLREADEVKLQMRLVSENLLTKVHREKYKKIHGKLHELWDKYDDGDLSTSSLLRAASQIAGLGPSIVSDQV